MPRSSLRTACALAAALVLPASASAQVGSTAAGTLVGTAGGAYLSLALTTAAARAGHFAFSPRQGLWRATPIPVGAVAGAVVGYQGTDVLRNVVRGGLVGLAGGSLLGAAIGRLIWEGPEGVWSGAIIVGGVGLLAGSISGGLRADEDTEDTPAAFSFKVPIPFSP